MEMRGTMVGQALEAAMLICFGLSWPMNAYKGYKARTAAGSSWQFILLITLGYVAGIAAKYVAGQINWVLIVYYLNIVFIGFNWAVYFRNTKLDRQRLQKVENANEIVNVQDAESNGETSAQNRSINIMVATDGSKASVDAVRFALDSLNLANAEVRVVCAVESDTREALDLANQHASQTADVLENAGISCKTEIRRGPAAEQIVASANEDETDLVVMGSRGLSGLRSLALGSVSRSVVERCSKPVLVVK
ncbi:MAG: universal stress protein [Coriobacteriales bacterium]|jgi:nucleotide-binding universal stress UspA family protein